ncbi:Hypothetical_protein [Hexamita inflata]|uniref:Hypothetical_protein n=1 Tax=Hexamita inflata TaxID=28002 RepID=A0AA86RGA5_9EUKA|nr:Hypothetical protein HINF_LOCUS60458 [Hexamita inflata]
MQQNNNYQPQRQNIQQISYQQPTLINQNSFQNSQQMPVQRQNNSSYQEQMQQVYQPALSNQSNSFQSNTQQIPNNNSFQASQAQQIPRSQNMSQKNESNGDDIYQKYNLLQEVLYSKKQFELDRDQNAYEVAKEYSLLTQERRLAAMEIAKLSEEREKRNRDKKTQTRQSGRCLKEASCKTRRKRSSSQSDQHYYIYENNNTEYHSLFQNISAQCFTSMSISSWCSFMYSMTLSCSFSWVHCMIGFRQTWSSRGCSKRSNSASMVSVERKCNQMLLQIQWHSESQLVQEQKLIGICLLGLLWVKSRKTRQRKFNNFVVSYSELFIICAMNQFSQTYLCNF